jgi:hypothetical protein
MSTCQHTITQGRAGETGSWCCACGEKIFAVDDRQCQDCANHKRLISGSICSRHLMGVSPTMNVTFRITNGSCFEPAASEAQK